MAGEFRRIAPRAEIVVVPLSLDPADYEPALLDGPPVAGVIGNRDLGLDGGSRRGAWSSTSGRVFVASRGTRRCESPAVGWLTS